MDLPVRGLAATPCGSMLPAHHGCQWSALQLFCGQLVNGLEACLATPLQQQGFYNGRYWI